MHTCHSASCVLLKEYIHVHCLSQISCIHVWKLTLDHQCVDLYSCSNKFLIKLQRHNNILIALLSSRVTVNSHVVYLYCRIASCCTFTQFTVYTPVQLHFSTPVCAVLTRLSHTQIFTSSRVYSVFRNISLCSSRSSSVFAKMRFCGVSIIGLWALFFLCVCCSVSTCASVMVHTCAYMMYTLVCPCLILPYMLM